MVSFKKTNFYEEELTIEIKRQKDYKKILIH